jgi:fatty-acyl-CoA synthase
MSLNPYDQDLAKTEANYAPLTPLGFLDWSAAVYPDRLAVVHGTRRFTFRDNWRQ